MLYPNPTATASSAQAEQKHPLEIRELDTLVRMWDPSTGQFMVFDRETGWSARFPTASRADEEMLKRFYKKREASLFLRLL